MLNLPNSAFTNAKWPFKHGRFLNCETSRRCVDSSSVCDVPGACVCRAGEESAALQALRPAAGVGGLHQRGVPAAAAHTLSPNHPHHTALALAPCTLSLYTSGITVREYEAGLSMSSPCLMSLVATRHLPRPSCSQRHNVHPCHHHSAPPTLVSTLKGAQRSWRRWAW